LRRNEVIETLAQEEIPAAVFSGGPLAEIFSPTRAILSAGFPKNATNKKRVVALALLVALGFLGAELSPEKINDSD